MDYSVREVYETCIGPVRTASLKRRLVSIVTRVVHDSASYDLKATNSKLNEFPSALNIGTVTAGELNDVYTLRMAKSGLAGRVIYDRIRSAPRFARCPLCDIGTVTTLDHHLPKATYPILSVTPNNLVPSCTWCQGAKGGAYPTHEGNQTLHPYYDDFESTPWLKAEVIMDSPVAFRFFVFRSPKLRPVIIDRLARHLNTFNLHELYSSNAGSELSSISARLEALLRNGGKAAVKSHLEEEYKSKFSECKNSWRTAMYEAAFQNDWFCAGGFSMD